MNAQTAKRTAFAAVEKVTELVGSVPSLVAHTLLFVAAFALGYAGVASWEMVLLVLTTAVSLEAIYLAIFIQMTVNEHTRSLREVEHDIEEIEEDIGELHENVEEISEEVSEEERGELERKQRQAAALAQLSTDVRRVLADLEHLKRESARR